MTTITSAKSKLGFIGIGYMGRPIAQRLLKAGFRLTAYDRHRTKAEQLVRYGGTVAENVAELSSNCDVVLSCLASDEAVLNIYKGADGAFANAHREALVIDLSTVNPQTSQELSRLGSARGVGVLDVTISGSTPAAEQGALILFGGGDQGCFAAAESIFRVIARKYFYLGPSGSGATMKLVVNSLLGIGMQAIAEAVALGEKAGLDRKRLLDVLGKRLGRHGLRRSFRNCGGRSCTCRQTGKSDQERLQPAISASANEQGFLADSQPRSCGRCTDARDTRGFRGQRGTIGPRTGARFFGGHSGDGKASSLGFRRQRAESGH